MADITVTLSDKQRNLMLRKFENAAWKAGNDFSESVREFSMAASSGDIPAARAQEAKMDRAGHALVAAGTEWKSVRDWLATGTNPEINYLTAGQADELAAHIIARMITTQPRPADIGRALAELITLIYGLDASTEAIDAKADQLITSSVNVA